MSFKPSNPTAKASADEIEKVRSHRSFAAADRCLLLLRRSAAIDDASGRASVDSSDIRAVRRHQIAEVASVLVATSSISVFAQSLLGVLREDQDDEGVHSRRDVCDAVFAAAVWRRPRHRPRARTHRRRRVAAIPRETENRCALCFAMRKCG